MRRSHVAYLLNNVFFFNDTATTEIYTLSLHDALPIFTPIAFVARSPLLFVASKNLAVKRSEEHTSELQSHVNLVCRLLLENKNTEQLSCVSAAIAPRGAVLARAHTSD